MSTFLDALARAGQPADLDLPSTKLVDRVAALRQDGAARFETLGLPNRRAERWKGTNVARLDELDFARVGPGESTDLEAIAADPRIVAFEADLLFVDGRMVRASAGRAALPAGVRVLSLAEAATEMPEAVARELGAIAATNADTKDDGIAALHDARFEDAAVVHLAKGARPGRALRILSVSTAEAGGTACFPRLLVLADASSEGLVLLESTSLGEAAGLSSVVSEFRLATDATVVSVALQTECDARVHLAQTHAVLERDARFASHVLSLSEGLVRSELSASMQAPGGHTIMNGLYLGRSNAHHDHFTTVDHAAPHCSSDEEYRGVLADEASGVFRGRVIVRPDAQKTDARQSNPNLLLSEGASIDTKPQLEIYADDVKASHGSTIGQLDEDALFFLRARGLAEPAARLLLTRAFAQTIVDGIDDEASRALVAERVDAALTRLQGDET